MSDIGTLSWQIVTPVTGVKGVSILNYEHQRHTIYLAVYQYAVRGGRPIWQKKFGKLKRSKIVSTLVTKFRSKMK